MVAKVHEKCRLCLNNVLAKHQTRRCNTNKPQTSDIAWTVRFLLSLAKRQFTPPKIFPVASSATLRPSGAVNTPLIVAYPHMDEKSVANEATNKRLGDHWYR